MKPEAQWNEAENLEHIKRHGVGFEDVIIPLQDGRMLDDTKHPNLQQYGHQRQLIVEIEDYAYAVPYVLEETGVFFKTLFPSRIYTKQYLDR